MSSKIDTTTQKQIKSLENGKIVIILPEDNGHSIPLFCPCCSRPMITAEDGISYRNNKICHKCDERWTGKPGIKWPRGPDKNSDEWKEYINNRNLLEKPILDFK